MTSPVLLLRRYFLSQISREAGCTEISVVTGSCVCNWTTFIDSCPPACLWGTRCASFLEAVSKTAASCALPRCAARPRGKAQARHPGRPVRRPERPPDVRETPASPSPGWRPLATFLRQLQAAGLPPAADASPPILA